MKWFTKIGKFLLRTFSRIGLIAISIFLALCIMYYSGIPYISDWAHNVLLGLDQWANAILGGDPDETISSRLGKWLTSEGTSVWDAIRKGFAQVICPPLDILNLEIDHCVKSIDTNSGKDAVIK